MPGNSKKILITTASQETIIVRRSGRKKSRAFCPGCAKQVEMLTLDEAVSAVERRARAIIRQLESGAIHSIETPSGHLLVCSISLQEFYQGKDG